MSGPGRVSGAGTGVGGQNGLAGGGPRTCGWRWVEAEIAKARSARMRGVARGGLAPGRMARTPAALKRESLILERNTLFSHLGPEGPDAQRQSSTYKNPICAGRWVPEATPTALPHPLHYSPSASPGVTGRTDLELPMSFIE